MALNPDDRLAASANAEWWHEPGGEKQMNLIEQRKALTQEEGIAGEVEWEAISDKLLGIEQMILDAPVTSIADVIAKVEIIANASKNLGDVSERLNQLHDQVVAFAASGRVMTGGRSSIEGLTVLGAVVLMFALAILVSLALSGHLTPSWL
jgi:hypothetical protein